MGMSAKIMPGEGEGETDGVRRQRETSFTGPPGPGPWTQARVWATMGAWVLVKGCDVYLACCPEWELGFRVASYESVGEPCQPHILLVFPPPTQMENYTRHKAHFGRLFLAVALNLESNLLPCRSR